jgi:hypothetical protein
VAGQRADAAGAGWRNSPARWLQEHGLVADWRLASLASALLVAISADLVRPALGWLGAKATGPGSLVRHLAHARNPDGFAQLKALSDADPHVSSVANIHTLHRAAEILATKGGLLADITVGDVLELLDAELDTLASVPGDAAVFYRLLRTAHHAPVVTQRSYLSTAGGSCRPRRAVSGQVDGGVPLLPVGGAVPRRVDGRLPVGAVGEGIEVDHLGDEAATRGRHHPPVRHRRIHVGRIPGALAGSAASARPHPGGTDRGGDAHPQAGAGSGASNRRVRSSQLPVRHSPVSRSNS